MADIIVNAGGNIQTAINSAVAGDRILLQSGATFTAALTLPNKGALGSPIIIRTNTADANLPATDYRITPTYSSVLAKIGSSGGGAPALTCDPGAQDYTLFGLEFLPQPNGTGDIIRLGDNNSSFQFVADQPDDILVDRCLIRGDPFFGTKRGIMINGSDITIKNCWIDRMAGFGQDSQAIQGANGSGPYTIVNNYLEAAAENFLLGGDTPNQRTFAEVLASPTPTTTSATLTNFRSGHTIATLAIGQTIAVLTNGGTVRQHTTVLTKPGGNAITFSALTVAPDSGTGSDISWGTIAKTVTFRRNHVRKNLAWRNPILSRPDGWGMSPNTTSGSLPAGTYYYVIQALGVGYGGSTVYALPTDQPLSGITLPATGRIDISWTAVPNASSYRIYGRVSNGWDRYWEVTAPTVTFSDTGTAGTSGTVHSASYWQEKNLFEIKAAQSVQCDSNIFENHWSGADIGYAIWLKSNNPGSTPFNWSKDIVFEKNIIRHVSGGIEFSGHEAAGGLAVNQPKRLQGVTIRNVLLHDSTTAYVDAGDSTARGFANSSTPHDLLIDHITWIHSTRAPMYFYGDAGITGMIIRNSIFRRESAGFSGLTYTEGTNIFNGFTTGGYTFTNNVIAGANASNYPAGNFFPTVPDFETNHFVLYDNGMNGVYSLVSGSPWKLAGTDAADLGVNYAVLMAAVAGVEAGTPESGVTRAVLDSVSTCPPGVSSGSAPRSWSHTCAGTDRLLTVSVDLSETTVTVASVTFNGIALGLRASGNVTAGPQRSEVWTLVNPPALTANIVVTLTGAALTVCGASSWSNAHQGTPFGTFVVATGDSNQAAVTVSTTAATDVVHDWLGLRTGATTITSGAGQTSLWNLKSATNTLPIGAGSTKLGTGSAVGFTWDVVDGTPKKWVHIAAAIKVASAITPPAVATSFNPPDLTTDVPVLTTLIWVAGAGATSHDVSLGTTTPPPFVQNQTGVTYTPAGQLLYDTTYYWRIDEVNAGGITSGPILQFRTALPVAPFGQPTFTISGIDRTRQVRAVQNVEIEHALHAAGVLRCETVDLGTDTTTAYRPAVDELMGVSLGGTLVFDGAINSVADRPLGEPKTGVVTAIEAVDRASAADQWFVNRTFAAGSTLKAIVTSLMAGLPVDLHRGFTLDPLMLDGPILPEQRFPTMTFRTALNGLSTTTGWIYRLVNGVLSMYDPDDAPIAKIFGTDFDGGQLPITGPVAWSKTRSRFANRVTVRYGSSEVISKTQNLLGNGVQTVWTLDYTPVLDGNGFILTAAWGVIESGILPNPLGLYPSSGMTWQWNPADNTLHRSSALGAGIPASLDYSVQFPQTTLVEDTTSQASVGVWESIVEAPDIFDRGAANEYGLGVLRRYKVQPREITIANLRTHVIPGDLVTIFLPQRQVTGRWMVMSTRLHDDATQALVYDITCVEGTEAVGNWIDFFKTTFSQGAGSALPVSSSDLSTGYGAERSLALISPAQITANQDNYNPPGLSSARNVRFSTNAARNLTGIAAQPDGTLITWMNIGAGANSLIVKHLNAGSSAANQIVGPGLADFTCAAGDRFRVRYDGSSSVWRFA